MNDRLISLSWSKTDPDNCINKSSIMILCSNLLCVKVLCANVLCVNGNFSLALMLLNIYLPTCIYTMLVVFQIMEAVALVSVIYLVNKFSKCLGRRTQFGNF